MKRFGIILFLAVVVNSAFTFGQCDSDEFLDNCASSLETYTFIKAFNVNVKKADKVEYSYVFSKGSNYMIIVCDQNSPGNRMIVNLYDRNHKLIVSSFNRKTKTYYPNLIYPCSATGVYYMDASFENSKGGCGVIILGFKKSE